MRTPEIHDRPSNVASKGGNVHVVGPDGVDVIMTPEAALETSERLLHGGMTAAGQRVQKDRQ